MAKFKKTKSVTGKFKYLAVANGVFIDPDTGEKVPVADIIESYIGDDSFDLAVSQKTEEEMDGDK